MFNKDQQFNLEKYQKQRKGKISVFGFSADFDWFFINLVTLLLLLGFSFLSIREIKHVLTFEPEPDTELQALLKDQKIISDLDEILKSFENKKGVEEIIVEESEQSEQSERE